MKMQEQALLQTDLSSRELFAEAVRVLENLIAIPSFSKEEKATGDFLFNELEQRGIKVFRKGNNVWAQNKNFDPGKPTLLLNSHHDTVKPNAGYKLSPFSPEVKEGKLFGLGSNDAGGALVSLLSAFLFFREKKDLRYNLIFAATAEEEISGAGGIESILPELGKIDFAIVGEPTQMNVAIAEKGLLVLDCVSGGTASHAAHEGADNAIVHAMKDIAWFSSYSFPERSEWLGDVKMNVTMIKAGTQHNIIPALCTFTVDIRTTEKYSNEKALEIIRENVSCVVHPRSLRLNSSSVSTLHPFVKCAQDHGRTCFGSPTLSDQALLPFPSVKIGPGNSLRSHTADEFIFLDELEEGIDLFIKILSDYLA